MLYASALMATSAPQRAAAFLEKHRQPVKSDIEVALARAYLAAGDKSKASDILHKLLLRNADERRGGSRGD